MLLIHIYASVPGEGVDQALPLLFAFTSCDIVLPFPEKGKKKAWETWGSFPEATLCFLSYSMFEALRSITIRHLKWCIVSCDPY